MNNGFKKGYYRALIPKNKCALCEITEKESDESFIEINHNKRVEIYKKMYPNFEIKFNTPVEDGDYN